MVRGKEMLVLLVLGALVCLAQADEIHEVQERSDNMEVVEVESRGWMSFLAKVLKLEGCEITEFKNALKKGMAAVKKKFSFVTQLFDRLKKEKGAEKREFEMEIFQARASDFDTDLELLEGRGWMSMLSKKLGIDGCQKEAFKKFLKWLEKIAIQVLKVGVKAALTAALFGR